ncbi:MAG: DUF72 domain-containing protein [Bryobacteraceae bacterium]
MRAIAYNLTMACLYAGTSGFAYPSWKPEFYPAKLPAAKFLQHYAERLNSVEINYTFRRLPSAGTLEKWVEATKPGFLFALKAHMRITHIERLQRSEFTELFFRAIDPLRVTGRLGPILFQLPASFRCDEARLAEFLGAIPSDLRYAMEFRHTSWLTSGVYDLLKRHGVSLCLAESDTLEIPEVITAGFVYSRLRKADYSVEDRAEIRDKTHRLLADGKDTFVYFKHEETPAGARYAEELLQS